MKQITIEGKVFEEYLDAAAIKGAVKRVGKEITSDYEGLRPFLLVVLNGSFVFAADLARYLPLTCEFSFIRVSSYEGTASSGSVTNILGVNDSIKDRDVVIIEDIVDSGNTIRHLQEHLSSFSPASVKVATLLFKPDCYKENYHIDYIAFETPPDFLIGYGLDYNGYGRNLPGIFKIKE